MFPVSDYGALGDGAADDRGAIQAAIDAAHDAGGGAVLFDARTYAIESHLIPRSHVTLRGAGRACTTILLQTSRARMLRPPAGHSHIRIEEMTLNGGGRATSFLVDVSEGTSDLHFRRVRFTGTDLKESRESEYWLLLLDLGSSRALDHRRQALVEESVEVARIFTCGRSSRCTRRTQTGVLPRRIVQPPAMPWPIQTSGSAKTIHLMWKRQRFMTVHLLIPDLIEHCLRKDPGSPIQAIGDVRSPS